MEIHAYFTVYKQLLDSILLHQDLATFGISTEADRSEDRKKLDLLFENKDTIKGKLRGLPDNSADSRDFLIKLRAISEKTSQIIYTIIGVGNINSEPELALFSLHQFWAEGTQFSLLRKPGTATSQEAENITTNTKTEKSYSGLAKALEKYIKNATDENLAQIINHKTPLNGKRLLWIGSKAEAMIFNDTIDMSCKLWNQCFYRSDGKPLATHNRSKNENTGKPYKEYPISKILKKHEFKN